MQLSLVPFGEYGILTSQDYLKSLDTVDKINDEINKVSLSDTDPVIRSEENNFVVDAQSYIDFLNDKLVTLQNHRKEQAKRKQKIEKKKSKTRKNDVKKSVTTDMIDKAKYDDLVTQLQQKDDLIRRLLSYSKSLHQENLDNRYKKKSYWEIAKNMRDDAITISDSQESTKTRFNAVTRLKNMLLYCTMDKKLDELTKIYRDTLPTSKVNVGYDDKAVGEFIVQFGNKYPEPDDYLSSIDFESEISTLDSLSSEFKEFNSNFNSLSSSENITSYISTQSESLSDTSQSENLIDDKLQDIIKTMSEDEKQHIITLLQAQDNK